MSRALIGILVGVLAGMLCGDLASHSAIVRDGMGEICRRGHLLAIVHGRGIYQADLDRKLRESDYLNDIERKGAAEIEQRSALNRLIAEGAAQAHAPVAQVFGQGTEREFNLLRAQFRDAQTWRAALHGSGLSPSSVRRNVEKQLRARQWIAEQIEHNLRANDDDCRRFYEAHTGDYFVPERMRASHIFLAAPPETAPETVDHKRKAIEELSVRLAGGEEFAALATANSEDEATKFNGGDLGSFSTVRMPPDFIAAVATLHPGETSQPVQTRLGFHIIRLDDTQPAYQRTFEEARTEIALVLANEARAAAIKRLMVQLGTEARFARSYQRLSR